MTKITKISEPWPVTSWLIGKKVRNVRGCLPYGKVISVNHSCICVQLINGGGADTWYKKDVQLV